jgi:arylsulfatase A-like enzyme
MRRLSSFLRFNTLLRATACCILLSASIVSASGQDSVRRFNVVMIIVDDLNDWVGPLGGYPGIKTPNIDRLARQGLTFRKAYCSAPACNPSRTSLLTGIRPSTSGVYHNKQPWRPVIPEALTLPEHFDRSDYNVAGIGKIFHIPYNDLNVWPRFVPLPRDREPARKPVTGKADDSFDWAPMPDGDEVFSDYKVVESGIRFLNERHDRPFFLAVGVYKPHLPWYVPKKYFDLYPLDGVTIPSTREDDLEDVPPQGLLMARTRGDHEFILEKKLWPSAVQAYCASISFVDAQIGRLLDALEKSPHRENTIVMLLSDHGWHLGEKMHWRKFTLWEESTRVPLIAIVPGLTKPGSVCDRTVSLLDIYPTLVELCGLSPNPALEGVSLVPLLKDPAKTWHRPAVTTNGLGNHAVRSGRWRYIQYSDGTEELYDHESDPREWHNVATFPAYRSVKEALRKWLPPTNAANAPFEGKD